jgi:hypothetical protein
MVEMARVTEYTVAPGTAAPSKAIMRFREGVIEELSDQSQLFEQKAGEGRIGQLAARAMAHRQTELLTPRDAEIKVTPSDKTVGDVFKHSTMVQQLATSPAQLAASLKGRVTG